MRRWLMLAGVTFALALALLFTATQSTLAQEPTKTPRPVGTPVRMTPTPFPRPDILPFPVMPRTLHTGGQTIGGPGAVKAECGTIHPIFANRLRENEPLKVSVTLVNEGGCPIYLAVASPTADTLEPYLAGPILPGQSSSIAVPVPYLNNVVVVCRGSDDARCAFEWRVDQVR